MIPVRLRLGARRWPSTIALLTQLAVLCLVTYPVLLALAAHQGIAPAPFAAALFQGVIAAAITAWLLPAARWWIVLQALFPLAVVVGLAVRWSPLVWLGAFVLLWLLNRNTVGERVPLYLSGQAVPQALRLVLPGDPFHFVDLGCGFGGVLTRLAEHYPQSHFEGIESAPLPWLIARLRLARRRNCRIRWGNFWRLSLADYQVVYCFLSPEPMAALWTKAHAELRPGALLISNTFAIDSAPPPHQVIAVPNATDPLYVWRM